MADEKEYLSPNDQRDADGNVTPADPEDVGKRQVALLESSGLYPKGKPTGYKVYAGWGVGTLKAKVKEGDVLKESEVPIPPDSDRAALLKELVQNGNLIPQYPKGAEVEGVSAEERGVPGARPAFPPALDTREEEPLIAEPEKAKGDKGDSGG
jgi:hypothetical protein